jgi:hypothetical protein
VSISSSVSRSAVEHLLHDVDRVEHCLPCRAIEQMEAGDRRTQRRHRRLHSLQARLQLAGIRQEIPQLLRMPDYRLERAE